MMMNGIVARITGAVFDNLMMLNLLIMAVLVGTSMIRTVATFGPPVVFAMTWGKLSQQIPKGIPNLTREFMPSSAGKNELLMRKPTCLYRFNGIHGTRHFTGGFFFSGSHRLSRPSRLSYRPLSA